VKIPILMGDREGSSRRLLLLQERKQVGEPEPPLSPCSADAREFPLVCVPAEGRLAEVEDRARLVEGHLRIEEALDDLLPGLREGPSPSLAAHLEILAKVDGERLLPSKVDLKPRPRVGGGTRPRLPGRGGPPFGRLPGRRSLPRARGSHRAGEVLGTFLWGASSL